MTASSLVNNSPSNISKAGNAPNPHQEILRVLHLSRWIFPGGGGIQTYLKSVAMSLADSKIALDAAAIQPGQAPTYLPSVLHLGKSGRPQWLNALSLGVWLWRFLPSVDVVHIHGVMGWPLLIGAVISRLRGVPYLVSTHGGLDPWFREQQKRLKAFVFFGSIGKQLLNSAVTIIATTAQECRIIQEFDSRLRVSTVPPGLVVEPTVSSKALRRNAGTHNPLPLKVIFLGRIAPKKGLPILFKAIAQLRRAKIETVLDIAGSGAPDYMDELHALAHSLAIEDLIRFRGYLSGTAKDDAIRSADVYALPSHSENFSFATAEVMALGLPVVISTGVALADTVQQYECGAVIPVEDPTALAEALIAYRDTDLRNTHGKRAHEAALKEFSLQTMGCALEFLYRQATDENKRILP